MKTKLFYAIETTNSCTLFDSKTKNYLERLNEDLRKKSPNGINENTQYDFNKNLLDRLPCKLNEHYYSIREIDILYKTFDFIIVWNNFSKKLSVFNIMDNDAYYCNDIVDSFRCYGNSYSKDEMTEFLASHSIDDIDIGIIGRLLEREFNVKGE